LQNPQHFPEERMTKQEILDFCNKNQVCTVATCDGKKPRVRAMAIYRAEKDGIIFHTGSFKDVYKQLLDNPNVELCFNHENIQIRICGTAALEKDEKLKAEIIEKRQFLKFPIEKHGYDSINVFRVKNMVATVWTMAGNLAPKEYIEIQ
jgi:pyridoxamine 5'-phosphate oxidase